MKVSVIVPVRNERNFIEECIDSIIAQDYPGELIEIIIVDGMSDDGTREIISDKYLSCGSNIKLIDNPKKIAPTAMNIGIKASAGDVIIRIDGHSYMERDFIAQAVKLLQDNPDIDCVGGPIESINTTFKSKVISLAMSSPFGVGNARFRYSKKAQLVDTLAFGAYRREVFEKIGLFDEELVRNQDDEFNFRLTKNGGKILLSPKIRSNYYTRSSFGKLWRQYYQYGFWKVRVMQKHGQVASLRHLVPVTFVLSLILTGVLSFVSHIFLWLFTFICLSYLAGALIFAVKAGKDEGIIYVLYLPFAFFILHSSYGLGFIEGIWHFYIKKGRTSKDRHKDLSR